MIKIRKVKLHEGQIMSLGDLYLGAFMDAATGQIQFTNHHLSDDIPVRQLKTRTKALNWYHWRMETQLW